MLLNLKNKNKFLVVLIFLLILIIITFLVSLNTGTLRIAPMDVIKTFIGEGSKKNFLVLFDFRLPRIIIALIVAACLAVSSTILQGVTKNELADPGIMGINSGTGLFVAIYIYITSGNAREEVGNFTIFTMPIVALIGALVAAILIYSLSYKKGINTSRLILMGIAVNGAFNALLITFQLRFSTQDFNKVLTWTAGSIWGTNWKYVMAILPWALVLIPIVLYKSKVLDVLNLGDEIPIGLGVNIEKERRLLLILSVCLAGIATSVAGSIAFLGLISPHIARLLVGPKHKRLIPIASLIGALILLISDTIARNVFAPNEIPVGMVISIIGAPYFIYLMLKVS